MCFLHTDHLNPLVKTLLEHLRQCPFVGTTRKRFLKAVPYILSCSSLKLLNLPVQKRCLLYGLILGHKKDCKG